MPLIATRGAASAQGFGEFAQSGPVNYIEDVFSTYLYTGNSSTQTITNGIDLSTKGGMVWAKCRTLAANHRLTDTVRGAGNSLISNSTLGNQTAIGNGAVTSFASSGYITDLSGFNSTDTHVSWTFRKQPKFFDVVTYTGDNTSSKAISHNLGSVPGCVIVKRTDSASHWFVWHRSTSGTPNNDYTLLNQTAATAVATDAWSSNAFTSTQFYVSNNLSTNVSGATYVAYLFAHNAGGFGDAGSDNVITCGSYTTDGSGNATVSLGYEPQWLLTKLSSTTGDWRIIDIMRGMSLTNNLFLYPNTSGAEVDNTFATWRPTATGFTHNQANANQTFIYIAIRRGPMKTPTTGTSVFSPIVATIGTGTTNFPVDLQILSDKGSTNAILNQQFVDRLRGVSSTTTQQGVYLLSSSTAAESSTYPYSSKQWSNTGFGIPQNYEGASSLYLSFRRAPGFFDVVCYTGTGSATTFSHNLGVVPEMMIVKNRNNAENWGVYSAALGNTKRLRLNSTDASVTASAEWNNTSPTASVFTVGTDQEVNFSGNTYVAYLFASCPGVSKVGSYTGSGTTKQIDCGFSGGARFVLIKRTDSTGDWYVWDSARGIVSGNDPYLLLNSTAAEVTNTDYVDTYSAGFEISSTAPAAINANGGTFIFLAVA